MCNCTNSYQEWTEYDVDNEYELREYEEFQDWHTAMMGEEWAQEDRLQDYGYD